MFDAEKGRGVLLSAALVACLAFSSALAVVALPPGTSLYKPDQLQVGQTGYSDTLPSYCTTDTPEAQLTAPITLPSAGQGPFHGTVTSKAFRNPAGGLTFTYLFENTGPISDPVIVVAGFSGQDWASAVISDVGADRSGSSGTRDVPEWTDGDPALITRSPSSLLEFYWQTGNFGTVIGPGDRSAIIWLVTDALTYRTSTVSLLDGGAIGQAAVLTAPEPLTLTLLAVGALLLPRRR